MKLANEVRMRSVPRKEKLEETKIAADAVKEKNESMIEIPIENQSP